MEVAGLVVNIVLAFIAAVAAGIAVWQASEARKSRVKADAAVEEARRAADASERQAAAAERAVELQEKANRRPAWRVAHINNDLFAVVNESGRVTVIDDVEVLPKGRPFFNLTLAESGRYEAGDRFTFAHSRRFASQAPEKMIVRWRFEGEDPGAVRELVVPLI